MAVELAQDIEEFLQLDRPLDATLAWNFPTIAALAAHLATHAFSAQGTTPSTQNSRRLGDATADPDHVQSVGFHYVSPNLQTLDDLSEVEMADTLAAELAALQGRGT
jgi:predicted metalloendopeptidase